MDHHRPVAIAIPLETWLPERSILLKRNSFPHPQGLHLVQDNEDGLFQRLQRLLFMARKAIVDQIQNY